MTAQDYISAAEIGKRLREHEFVSKICRRVGISHKDKDDGVPVPKNYYFDPFTGYWLPVNLYILVPGNL